MKFVKYLIAALIIVGLTLAAPAVDAFAGRVVRTRTYSSTSSVSVRAPVAVEYSEYGEACDASRDYAASCDASQTFETRTRSRTKRVRSRAPRAFTVYAESCDNN